MYIVLMILHLDGVEFKIKADCFLLINKIVVIIFRGSAIAKVIGNNVKNLSEFETEIKMWVFEEEINGRKLTEIINTDHENVKYLPGHKIPENVVCMIIFVET